ncbi:MULTISPECIES: hypothetical protein [unclassified Variovorax]|uniref:hypothetical protein n=1 Tax=unclassified Variovorax TaxID=663243 RepID=UPI0008D23A65|nr:MULTISPECIES: hypothetical protein [unclassified Variovorax]SEJ99002.1 hypothetical protein SAMN05518853_105416 [Variovorax sp. OK202]SFD25310.1 hypothetical protein SAMN05444746_105456 [Variovorax sp. OK212]
MNSPITARALRAGFRLLTLAASLGAAAAQASGGYDPVDLFFATTRPDQPVREFIERPAGYYTDYLVPYQVLWYWRLHGQSFSPEAVRAFSDLLEKLPREDNGMDDTDTAWTVWRQARSEAYAKLGHPLPAPAKPATPPSQQTPQWNADSLQASPNCFYGDAFRNAAKTLAERMERAGGDKAAGPFVLHWLQVQDAVFDTCDEKAAAKPSAPSALPALPERAPAWLKADHAYQLAAQRFYAGDLDGADTAFDAIASDKASPWRDLAAYMRLRVLARQNPGGEPSYSERDGPGKESPEALKQQAELTQAVDAIALPLLKNPRLQALHASVHRLAESLRIRHLTPGTRLQRLADGLKTMGAPDVAAARLLLLNHEFRSCAIAGCAYVGPEQKPDLVQWLSTVRGFDGPSGGLTAQDKWREKFSWSSYQRTHDLAWLMAAASLVPAATTADDKREAELQAALAAVPEDHPARFAATQLRAQRLFAQGRFKEARELVAGTADSPLIAHSLSGQNLVKALLLPTAASEEEWRRLAIRPVVAHSDPEAMEAKPSAVPLASAFDDDVVRFLNTRAPLAMWLRLAADPALSPALRDTLLETAWTRAVLAEDYATARRAAQLRVASAPTAPTAPAASVKGPDTLAGIRRSVSLAATDTAAWHRLLLERMVSTTETLQPPHWPNAGWDIRPTPLRPAQDVAAQRGTTPGTYGKWCSPLGVQTSGPQAAGAADFEMPAFVPQAERKQQAALVARLRSVPQDSVYFTQESLALMQRDKADALVPQALSVAVKMARYTCPDKTVGDWSRKGLQALHANYPKSTWAASTPYWYGGR